MWSDGTWDPGSQRACRSEVRSEKRQELWRWERKSRTVVLTPACPFLVFPETKTRKGWDMCTLLWLSCLTYLFITECRTKHCKQMLLPTWRCYSRNMPTLSINAVLSLSLELHPGGPTQWYRTCLVWFGCQCYQNNDNNYYLLTEKFYVLGYFLWNS